MLRPLIICLSLILAMSGPAWAQTNVNLGGIAVDTTAALEVNADSLSVDQDSGKAIFVGNVVIIQGDLRLTADQVEVVYGTNTSQIDRLIASGGVTFVTSDEAAEAQNADYDITTGFLVLTGDVLLTQGPSAISAAKMTINVSDGTATMDGRVRTILQQGNN